MSYCPYCQIFPLCNNFALFLPTILRLFFGPIYWFWTRAPYFLPNKVTVQQFALNTASKSKNLLFSKILEKNLILKWFLAQHFFSPKIFCSKLPSVIKHLVMFIDLSNSLKQVQQRIWFLRNRDFDAQFCPLRNEISVPIEIKNRKEMMENTFW